MEEEVLDNEIYSRNVIEFVTVANEYCSFLEKTDSFSKKDFVERSQKLFALLYLKSSLLPEIENVSDVNNEKFVLEGDWFFIKEKVSQKLGLSDVIVDIATPIMQSTEDIEETEMSECYADIYQDLKDFLMLYRIGSVEATNDGLWECKLNFEQYWGSRLLEVLSQIHNFNYGKDDLEEELN